METGTVQRRELPHPILENIWMWSVFSEEKGFYFNGFALLAEDGLILVDPPSADAPVLECLAAVGAPKLVILTNRDHERASDALRRKFGIPVAAPLADAPLLEVTPEQVYQDGDLLPGGLKALHLRHQKSPGESALYRERDGLLVLGDALIGKQPGKLFMLPDEKYADPALAREGLSRLRGLTVKALLLGDGEPELQQAQGILDCFFDAGASGD